MIFCFSKNEIYLPFSEFRNLCFIWSFPHLRVILYYIDCFGIFYMKVTTTTLSNCTKLNKIST